MEDLSLTRFWCCRTTPRVGPMASGRKRSMNGLVLRSSSTPKTSRVITGREAQESCTPQQHCLYFNFTIVNFLLILMNSISIMQMFSRLVLKQRAPLLIQRFPRVLLAQRPPTSLLAHTSRFVLRSYLSFLLCVSPKGAGFGALRRRGLET